MADSVITLPRTTQQPHYSCSKTPELHQVLGETPRRPFHGLAAELNTFSGLYESFATLTIHIDCQSTAIIDLHAANGQVLNEPASRSIFAVSLPFSLP